MSEIISNYQKNKKSYMKYYEKTMNVSFRLRKDNKEEMELIHLIEEARDRGVSAKTLIMSALL